MRKSITEREIYRKLKILERHSAFKQPYKFKTHVNSELNWEPKGYPWTPPGGWPPYPPVNPQEKCDFGCNPSMLDCEGGCTTIVCTCPIFGASIIHDPTGGSAQLMTSTFSDGTFLDPGGPGSAGSGTGQMTIAVCISDATCLITDEYAKVIVRLWPDTAYFLDDFGYVDVEVAVVDCRCCCEAFTLTGNDNVNAGGTWTGTISPACPGATATVVSNSGCDFSGTGIVNDAGSQVTVAVQGSDCGSFTVTVTCSGDEGCAEESASKAVLITGDGATWVNKEAWSETEFPHVCTGCTGAGIAYDQGPCYKSETGFIFAYFGDVLLPFSRQNYDCTPPRGGISNTNWCNGPVGGCTVFRWYRWEWECAC